MGKSSKRETRTYAERRAYMLEWYARNPGKMGEYARAYEARNIEKVRAYRRRHRAASKAAMDAEKLRRGACANPDCRLPVTPENVVGFDFDHRDRTTKVTNAARLRGPALVAEMEKCDLLCATCHRQKTIRERDWGPVSRAPIDSQLSLFDEG
jgi:hypothetical protein